MNGTIEPIPLKDVPEEKKILDVTCGARSVWFNKRHPAAIYCDKRKEEYHHLWKNAGNCTLSVDPDILCDFTSLPFEDNSFSLVVFDPPHLTGAKETSWLVKKYGKLDSNWPQMLHDGFRECMRGFVGYVCCSAHFLLRPREFCLARHRDQFVWHKPTQHS